MSPAKQRAQAKGKKANKEFDMIDKEVIKDINKPPLDIGNNPEIERPTVVLVSESPKPRL